MQMYAYMNDSVRGGWECRLAVIGTRAGPDPGSGYFGNAGLACLGYHSAKGIEEMVGTELRGVRIRGPLACFTRPELKAERVSYPVITPSAARGVFEAVLWKPAIRWHIDRIDVLAPIRWMAFRRNEVNSRASAPTSQVIEKGGAAPALVVEQDRAQRNTVALRDVDYVVYGHFEMTDKAGPGDNPGKFTDMFRRRLANGQHFSMPYLGCREFVAELMPVDENLPQPIDDSRDLGRMLFDIDFGASRRNRPLFFEARLERGVLHVPSLDSVLAASRKGGSNDA